MVRDEIGGRPADITSEGGRVRIVFHPMAENAKHPDAAVFTVTLARADIEKIRKVL